MEAASAVSTGIAFIVVFFACPVAVALGVPVGVCFGLATAVLAIHGHYLLAILAALLMFTPRDVLQGRVLYVAERLEALMARLSSGLSSSERGMSAEEPSERVFTRFGHSERFKPVGSGSLRPEAVLGVATGFTRADLDAARRAKAKLFHPDVHRDAPRATQAVMADNMRQVNRAYEALKPLARAD